jgi:hypothetical protein
MLDAMRTLLLIALAACTSSPAAPATTLATLHTGAGPAEVSAFARRTCGHTIGTIVFTSSPADTPCNEATDSVAELTLDDPIGGSCGPNSCGCWTETESPLPTPRWSLTIGDVGTNGTSGVALDEMSDIAIAGHFSVTSRDGRFNADGIFDAPLCSNSF